MDQDPHQEHHHNRREFPVKRTIFWTGILLTLVGYGFLSVPAETISMTAGNRAFTGLGLMISGAFLWLGTIFFS